MENKVRLVVLLCFVMSIISCNTQTEKPAASAVDKEKIKQEIQARQNEFAELYNNKELKSIGYYADDARTYAPHRPPLVGKEAIIAEYRGAIDSSSADTKMKLLTHEVFVSNDANQVVELGYYEIFDSVGVLNRGNYMTLFEKRDGMYVSIREMSVTDLPLPPPAE